MEGVANLSVREARAEDHSDIYSCVHAAYALYVDRIGKPPAPMLDDYSDLIERGVVRVAHRGNQLLGLIVMWPEEDHFFVDNIAVHPDAQGVGVGATLLAEADDQARRTGHSEIRLYTNAAMVENIDYYPRKGYRETHRAADAGYERVYFSRHLGDS